MNRSQELKPRILKLSFNVNECYVISFIKMNLFPSRVKQHQREAEVPTVT